jgi:hypothetical protein
MGGSSKTRVRRIWVRKIRVPGQTSGSGASTYPANRDFKGHVGPPQGFVSIFFEFLLHFQGEKG